MKTKLTPHEAKKLAIELLAQAMVPDVVKLAKANYKATWVGTPPDSKKMRQFARDTAVESAMDAYESDRILMEEISSKVTARLFKLADAEMSKK